MSYDIAFREAFIQIIIIMKAERYVSICKWETFLSSLEPHNAGMIIKIAKNLLVK